MIVFKNEFKIGKTTYVISIEHKDETKQPQIEGLGWVDMLCLSILQKNKAVSVETGLTRTDLGGKMKEVYKQRRGKYPTKDLASDVLNRLKRAGITTHDQGEVRLYNRAAKIWKTVKKPKHFLTEDFLQGRIQVDEDGWLIVDGQYLADEKTRRIAKQRELKRKARQA